MSSRVPSGPGDGTSAIGGNEIQNWRLRSRPAASTRTLTLTHGFLREILRTHYPIIFWVPSGRFRFHLQPHAALRSQMPAPSRRQRPGLWSHGFLRILH